MVPPPPAALLRADHVAFLRKGVSAIVASRDAAHRPSLMRAVGYEVAEDGGRVAMFLARSQSRQLLQDIAATGELAVVFSEPLSHRTLQLKARQASLRPATPADRPLLERYLAAMEHEIGAVGFPPAFVRAMFAWQLDDLVVVAFVPEQAFDQTPGPRAGQALAEAA